MTDVRILCRCPRPIELARASIAPTGELELVMRYPRGRYHPPGHYPTKTVNIDATSAQTVALPECRHCGTIVTNARTLRDAVQSALAARRTKLVAPWPAAPPAPDVDPYADLPGEREHQRAVLQAWLDRHPPHRPT